VYSWKETAINFYLSILNGGLDLLIRGVYLLVLLFFYKYKVFAVENSFLYWALLLILLDFQFYWLHRLEHYCRLFWAVHVTHHSSELMNFTVGFRSSVFQPLYRFIFFIPLTLVGFRPLDILFLYSLMQFWAIFVHTEFVKKLGWLEYIFVTPSHHRVHHASNILYLDKNMGMFLIIWDKMFGTFQREIPADKYEPIRYGLTSPIKKETPLTIIFHEWMNIGKDLARKDLSFKQKLQYLFRPPGWSHDGSRKTSDELRREVESGC
jgi:sterol desaturase/sphingolipid hydroxylase (fatty acid hydroxylase superfamily)